MTTPSAGLDAIDAVFERIHRLTDWAAVFTPVNAAAERRRFLDTLRAGGRSEPAFEYREPDLRAAGEAATALAALDLSGVPAPLRPEYEHARDLFDLQLRLLDAFARRDDDRVGLLSRQLYWEADTRPLLDAAHAALSRAEAVPGTGRDPGLPVSADVVAAAVQRSLDDYGVAWTTRIDASSAARVRVSRSDRQVVLSRDARFREVDIRKIVVHEVETHVLRAENGRRLWRFGLYGLGTPVTERMEEGMALMNERTAGVARPDQARIVALHVVGIDTAATRGFSDTFEAVRPYVADDGEAFQRVVRWKRGLHDQRRPNAFWKDVVYFGGGLRLEAYLRAGGDLRELYLGRFDDRRAPGEVRALLDEFGRGPDISPMFPRSLQAA
jgi:hypothetical protein